MAMHAGEATQDASSVAEEGAKLKHSCLLQSGFGQDSSRTSNQQRIHKRSLKRAYQRMSVFGHTWYRGQLWTKSFSFTMCDTSQIDSSRQSSTPWTSQPRGWVQLLHWNAGALSSAKYLEMLHGFKLNCIDIGILTETHWSFDEEWIAED